MSSCSSFRHGSRDMALAPDQCRKIALAHDQSRKIALAPDHSQVMFPEVLSTGTSRSCWSSLVCWGSSEAGCFSRHGHGGHSQAACFSCCLDGSGS